MDAGEGSMEGLKKLVLKKMEDPDGTWSLEAGPTFAANTATPSNSVCRHWLRSLCNKGDACRFLHQYDKTASVLGNSVISDDFNTAAPSNGAPVSDVAGHEPSAESGGKGSRKTVCRAWLRSSCKKGDACGFLHQDDKTRMPACRFFARFGTCRDQDCVFKHTEAKERNRYFLDENGRQKKKRKND